MYEYKITFELNKHQRIASNKIIEAYQNGANILLDAVCGAGKTEMLLAVIKMALNQGKTVGFACPRQQLLIELYERIDEYFNHEQIGLVCGKIKKYQRSNFIFLTTHQLIKYPQYFDLLIIDEVDAFPFCDNYRLEQAALLAGRQFIYLSATIPIKYRARAVKKQLVLVHNYYRHHLQKAVKPGLVVRKGVLKIAYLLSFIKHNQQPLIVYVSSIKKGYQLERILRLLLIKVKFVYSKNLTDKTIEQLKNHELKLLLSTTVLERGITLKQLNVIVYDCENTLFNSDTLIQICGRVGRDRIHHQGKIIFLADHVTEEQLKTLQRIDEYNEMSNLSP